MEIQELIKKIKQKKELSDISNDVVAKAINSYLARNKLFKYISSLSEKELKLIIKDIRAELRRFSGQYQTSFLSFNEKLSLLKENKIVDLLKTHSSTKERLDFYPELRKIISSLNISSILDIGCGLNPIALASLGVEYYAFDIKEDDVKLVNEYFDLNNINGLAFIEDIASLNIAHLPEADLCLLFKILDIIPDKNHKIAGKIISELKCRYFLISFSTKTLSGRPMLHVKRPWLERILKNLNLPFKTFRSKNEIFYLAEKKKANVLRETFGTFKFKKPTEQMMKEMDKELYDV